MDSELLPDDGFRERQQSRDDARRRRNVRARALLRKRLPETGRTKRPRPQCTGECGICRRCRELNGDYLFPFKLRLNCHVLEDAAQFYGFW
jgi:hypothetical protein